MIYSNHLNILLFCFTSFENYIHCCGLGHTKAAPGHTKPSVLKWFQRMLFHGLCRFFGRGKKPLKSKSTPIILCFLEGLEAAREHGPLTQLLEAVQDHTLAASTDSENHTRTRCAFENNCWMLANAGISPKTLCHVMVTITELFASRLLVPIYKT